jgi:YVTN family beta-propeller protein
MEIRLLGLMEATVNGRAVALGPVKQRAVLAMLALNPNARVSVDRLIEGLWGEEPPSTAAKMVQLYVSHLRKLLDGAEAEIVTRGRGYELRVPADSVDAVRFERLVDEVARGDGTSEVAVAGEALALWRGPPLGDLADEPFAAAEIRRLEELWLRARELWIDGALAAGEHRQVVGELDELLAAHPLRERLHTQRMLALYRSGRQAEALEAYRWARRVLVEDVGIEPGPELRRVHEAILEQDPSLDLAVPERPRAVSTGGRRRAALAWLLLALLVLGGAVAGAALLRGDDASGVVVRPNSVAVIDPADNRIVEAIQLNQSPGPVAAGAGILWVLDVGSATVTRIDPGARELLGTRGMGEAPGNLAASATDVWVHGRCEIGGVAGLLLHIYTIRDGGIDLDEEIPLEPVGQGEDPPLVPLRAPGCGLAAEGRSAWVATNVTPGLARVDNDPTAGQSRIAWRRALPRVPVAMAVDFGSVWAVDAQQDVVRRIDAGTGRTLRIVRAGNDPTAIATGAGAVWVANRGDGSLSRIDPRTNVVRKAISVGDSPAAVAVGAGAAWVANAGDGTVSRVDPATNRVVETIRVGHGPQGIAVAAEAVWTTVGR